MKPIFVLFIMCLLPFNAAHALATYQDGDIIFQESQSLQSRAIKEVTNSRWSHVGILFQHNGQWSVAEAVQPVKMTPLNEWLDRGKNHAFRVYRFRGLTDPQRRALRAQVEGLLGQNYDIYFEWSDTLIYCSELVYKTFLKAAQVKIGTVQHYRYETRWTLCPGVD